MVCTRVVLVFLALEWTVGGRAYFVVGVGVQCGGARPRARARARARVGGWAVAWGWERGPDGSFGGSMPRMSMKDIDCLAFGITFFLMVLGGIFLIKLIGEQRTTNTNIL